MIDKYQVSIVICSHRRFDLLRAAVASLCCQTAPKKDFEIIVVDNDVFSNVEVVKIVDDVRAIINISYIHEPVLGLSQARNVGGKAALSEYVGYMDDDAKAKENYIELLSDLIGTHQYDIIGGPFFAYFLSKRPCWFNDKYETCTFGSSLLFQNHEFLNGTNMVYRKSLLNGAGCFDRSFGMSGTQIAYGEETNLQIRLWKQNNNLKVFYCSDLIVYHLVPEHKMKLTDKFRRSYNVGKSQTYMWIPKDSINSAKKEAPYILSKTIIILCLFITPKIFFSDLKTYPYWQNYAYEVIARYFASIGQEWQRTKDLFSKRN